MDPINLLYYGIVCGGLALLAPELRSRPARALAGILVGLAAAALLPMVKGLLMG